jgi:protein phosphatase
MVLAPQEQRRIPKYRHGIFSPVHLCHKHNSSRLVKFAEFQKSLLPSAPRRGTMWQTLSNPRLPMDTFHQADTAEFEFPAELRGDQPAGGSALVQVDVAGLSHQGKVRVNNEDHFLIIRFGRFLESLDTNLPPAALPARADETGYGMVVADGMGGHAGGEEASKLVISTLVNLVLSTPDWILRLEEEQFFQEEIRRTTERCGKLQAALTQQAQDDPNLRGFGTTLTYALSLGKDLLIAHVGDSRAYLLRQRRLQQLTRDHTVAQSLADCGIISQDEVATHHMRHMLVKHLGTESKDVQPDVEKVFLEDGDCLLLCTDGLHDLVPDDAIAQALGDSQPAAAVCQRLVDLALQAGGKDNVTVLVARYRLPVS